MFPARRRVTVSRLETLRVVTFARGVVIEVDAFIVPLTSRADPGTVVPIPTRPFGAIRMLGDVAPLTQKSKEPADCIAKSKELAICAKPPDTWSNI